jgi:hypothetical protein
MKQWSGLVLAGSGILGFSFSLAAQAASLGPSPAGAPSGAAWADAGTAPLLPAAGLLAWAPLLLVALLGAILAVLIWRQPGSGQRPQRRSAGALRVSLAASGPSAAVETWRGAVSAPRAPAKSGLQRAAADATLDGAALISAVKR